MAKPWRAPRFCGRALGERRPDRESLNRVILAHESVSEHVSVARPDGYSAGKQS